MQVICLEEPAFYALLEEVINRLKPQQEITPRKWVDGKEAMQLLNIKSKTSLQTLRIPAGYASRNLRKKSFFMTTIPLWSI